MTTSANQTPTSAALPEPVTEPWRLDLLDRHAGQAEEMQVPGSPMAEEIRVPLSQIAKGQPRILASPVPAASGEQAAQTVPGEGLFPRATAQIPGPAVLPPAPDVAGPEPTVEATFDPEPQTAGLLEMTAATKERDSAEPARTLDIQSLVAQTQRPLQASADSGRTDGLGLAAAATLDRAYQSNGPSTAPSPNAQMGRPAGAPGWGDELGDRVLWLVGQRENMAELRLNPPELGSLEIRIRQKKDATSVSFVVQSGSAREAVETALPRLRELFAEAGLSLQSLDVAERQAGDRRGGEGDRGTGGGPEVPEGGSAGVEPPPPPPWRGEGVIDAYV